MINIVTPEHTLFAANQLAQALSILGYPAQVIDKLDPKNPNLHIIYAAQYYSELPSKYIVYQTEVAGSHHFKSKYLHTLAGAVAVWDYSATNVAAYRHLHTNIHVIPPWVSASTPPLFSGGGREGVEGWGEGKRDIPILFYGWIEGSPRRQRLLQEIQQLLPKYNQGEGVKIITNTLGPEMWHLLRRTKVVLNLHYFENSPLEMFRITEANSYGCHVVSEPCGIHPNINPNIPGLTLAHGASSLAMLARHATTLPPPPVCDGYVQTPLQKALQPLQRAGLLM